MVSTKPGQVQTSYPTIKRILEAGLDTAPVADSGAPTAPLRYTFVRQASDFGSQLWGAVR